MISQRLRSKTYWVSFLTIIIASVGASNPNAAALIAEHQGVLLSAIGVIGMIVRELTKKPLSEK